MLGRQLAGAGGFCAKGWALSYAYDPARASATALAGARVEWHVFTEGTAKADMGQGTWNLTAGPMALAVGQWYHVVVRERQGEGGGEGEEGTG